MKQLAKNTIESSENSSMEKVNMNQLAMMEKDSSDEEIEVEKIE